MEQDFLVQRCIEICDLEDAIEIKYNAACNAQSAYHCSCTAKTYRGKQAFKAHHTVSTVPAMDKIAGPTAVRLIDACAVQAVERAPQDWTHERGHPDQLPHRRKLQTL